MRCVSLVVITLVIAASGPGVIARAAQTPPAQTPPPQTTPAPKPAAPAPTTPVQTAGQSARTATAAAARLPLSVLVTAMDGKTLPDVWVKATGPVDREGSTDPSGNVNFTNMAAGTYRLRFEHDQFVTFEKEVAVARGGPSRIAVALNAAPPKPEPPKPEPPPAPAPVSAPTGNYIASSYDIPELVEKNFIGSGAIKRSPVGCTASTTSTMIQLRDPLAEHSHPDQDELIYVVAGEGVHKVGMRDGPREHALAGGVFVSIPRGTQHSITRKGRQPLVLISTLTGTPCQTEK
jgi:mannose-6-phosphate isomerase-like protein (cupin superfamily)